MTETLAPASPVPSTAAEGAPLQPRVLHVPGFLDRFMALAEAGASADGEDN